MSRRLYTVLYADDVPHYGSIEIEAASDAEALAKAMDAYCDEIPRDPGYENVHGPRIVHIEDEHGAIIAEDIALDDSGIPLQSLVATIEGVIAQIAVLRQDHEAAKESDPRWAALAADVAAIARWIEKARNK